MVAEEGCITGLIKGRANWDQSGGRVWEVMRCYLAERSTGLCDTFIEHQSGKSNVIFPSNVLGGLFSFVVKIKMPTAEPFALSEFLGHWRLLSP